MATGDTCIIIVGAGQAGARAAKSARAAGFDGRIMLVGKEPHPPYERPLLSKALLMDPATPIPWVMPFDSYSELGIELLTGVSVTAIDRAEKSLSLDNGTVLPYDKLLLSTGSVLRPFQLAGYPAEDIYSLRTIDDSRSIVARLATSNTVAVVGGGFIGLETAATMAAKGCSVTVVEMADALLPRLGCPEASDMVLRHHRAAGIDVRLGVFISSAEPGVLHLSDGSEIAADFVVAGVGVMPDTALAQAAGLAVDDGILVDEFGQTSDPHIFAAGDVTRHFTPLLGKTLRLESWQNANAQAEAAGKALAGIFEPSQEVPWLWSDQGDLNLQMAGAPADVDEVVIRGKPDTEGGMTVFQLSRGVLVGGVTINRGKEMTPIRRLLAAGGKLALPAAMLADESIALRKFQEK